LQTLRRRRPVPSVPLGRWRRRKEGRAGPGKSFRLPLARKRAAPAQRGPGADALRLPAGCRYIIRSLSASREEPPLAVLPEWLGKFLRPNRPQALTRPPRPQPPRRPAQTLSDAEHGATQAGFAARVGC